MGNTSKGVIPVCF